MDNSSKLIRIKNWGNVELKTINLANCTNLTEFIETFYNTKITEIPEGLFKNCNKAESFWGTFANCTELTNYLPYGILNIITVGIQMLVLIRLEKVVMGDVLNYYKKKKI